MPYISKDDVSAYEKKFISYLERKGYTEHTIQSHKSTINIFYKFLDSEMNTLPPILSKEEVERLIKSAREKSFHLSVLIELLYFTGVRFNEAINLKKQDVDIKEGIISFPHTKHGHQLKLRIHSDLAPSLTQLLDEHPAPESPYVFNSVVSPEKPYSKAMFRFKIKLFKEIAGIKKDVTPQILRRTMASHFMEKASQIPPLSSNSAQSNADAFFKVIREYFNEK